jgi:hypothetical protein
MATLIPIVWQCSECKSTHDAFVKKCKWCKVAFTAKALKPSHNKQSAPCKHCSGARSMFGFGCYCPWCGRKIE